MTVSYLLREGRLTPADAAVALILLEDGRYLAQLRDDKPGIFFPGHWGLFGGGLDPGEKPEDAVRRELREEIGVVPAHISYFTKYSFEFAALGHGLVHRYFYEALLNHEQAASIQLSEGREARAFHAAELLKKANVTPYDAFAVWMHAKHVIERRPGAEILGNKIAS